MRTEHDAGAALRAIEKAKTLAARSRKLNELSNTLIADTHRRVEQTFARLQGSLENQRDASVAEDGEVQTDSV